MPSACFRVHSMPCFLRLNLLADHCRHFNQTPTGLRLLIPTPSKKSTRMSVTWIRQFPLCTLFPFTPVTTPTITSNTLLTIRAWCREAICDQIGHMYYGHCCNCLRRMGAMTMDWYNYSGCASCKARWESLPDKSPLPKPGGGGCCTIN